MTQLNINKEYHLVLEEFKKEKNYCQYEKKDLGYLVIFEHENETKDLIFKK